jgi:hypothetical protein
VQRREDNPTHNSILEFRGIFAYLADDLVCHLFLESLVLLSRNSDRVILREESGGVVAGWSQAVVEDTGDVIRD